MQRLWVTWTHHRKNLQKLKYTCKYFNLNKPKIDWIKFETFILIFSAVDLNFLICEFGIEDKDHWNITKIDMVLETTKSSRRSMLYVERFGLGVGDFEIKQKKSKKAS